MSKMDNVFIFYYTENARAKIKDIARITKKSSQRLKYTIGQIEKESIVSCPFAIIDYSFFGVLLFRVYFKGGYINDSDKDKIIKSLSRNPHVMAIYDLTGEFDFCIEIGAPNPSRFKKELKDVARLLPTLNDYKIILNVVTHIHPRYYLLPKTEIVGHYVSPDVIIGGDRQPVGFDEDELSVLKCLIENPRMRLTFIAEKANLNVKTVVSIMKKLQERKILKGCKFILNTEKLGIHRFRLFLKLHNVCDEKEKQLLKFMNDLDEVVLIHKTVGDWDMEIDVESQDRKQVRAIIVKLRELFADMIENFNIIEENEFYKRTYLPEYLFLKNSEIDKDSEKLERREVASVRSD